jgi:hypothetical protein
MIFRKSVEKLARGGFQLIYLAATEASRDVYRQCPEFGLKVDASLQIVTELTATKLIPKYWRYYWAIVLRHSVCCHGLSDHSETQQHSTKEKKNENPDGAHIARCTRQHRA